MPYSSAPFVGGGIIPGSGTYTGTNEFTGQTNISGPDSNTNVEIGSVTNDANAGTGGTSVVIGNGATNTINGTGVVIIGSLAAVTTASGVDSMAIGRAATVTSANGIAIGAGASAAGGSNVALGNGATAAANSVAIGLSSTAAANEFVCGSTSSGAINNVYFGKGKTNATATAYAHNGTGGFGANNAGADVILAGGKGTGTAAGGDVRLQTSVSIGSGSTPQTLGDRDMIRAQAKALTESSATSFARITTAAGEATGGQVDYTIIASDGTDHQARSGSVYFAGVNKATAVTAPAPTEIGTSLVAVSTGTLTVTWTAVNAANTFDLQANAVSSLTQTTLAIYYRVRLNGPGTVSAL
jgi:trimeric autotransporter adhesin